MKKKTLSIILSILLFFNVAIPLMAYAKSSVTVFDGKKSHSFQINSENITQTLKKAFSYCDSYSDKKFTVTIPKGKYTVSSPITLCNNTTLDLTDEVVLVNGKNNTNIFIGKRGEKKYNGTKNFKVLGGTLTYSDDYAGNGCQVRIAHGNNISFYKTVFKNNYNSHNVEIAACSGVMFEKCVFKNGRGSLKNNSGEALQIDILEEDLHFKVMPEYDGTMNTNITVNKCTFTNLLRGIGTNSAFAGLYHKKIKVTNCVFNNIKSTAITFMNYTDSVASNNTITNCGEGIVYSVMKDDANLSKMNYIKGKGAPVSDCNSIISSNSISVINTDSVSFAVGIQVFGNDITKSKNVGFNKGNYFVGKIKIKENDIKTENYGIRMFDVRNSNVAGNTLNGKETDCGILLDSNSKSNKIYGNTVNGFDKGIFLLSGNDNILKKNTLSNNVCGIYYSLGIKATTHYNRFISNKKSSCSEGEDEAAVFSNMAMPKISLSKNRKSVTVKWNKIKNAKYYQVYRSTSKSGKYKKIATLKADKLSFKDENVKKGRKYYYKIRAKRKINGITNYSSFSKRKLIKI